ncbi:MAG: NAD(P)H-binding protein [Rhodospirillaceae bacterium]|jgi:saccharopine dehydrogenase-like NADP-dependent oxidoreductase|nr:NAD(P)H-binding protein [Rhodospirillaceae bacterium]MBT4588848.1 NAD(P)H-binding protein [Rhodospirillaceae bacterium]MBT5940972.1 NAD(P)H-binding protein [Rhodospirillaceae bacterium]MBT7266848.1 NAD(P)H-binding protein [Rhodospirillaceae bacterium]
MTNSPTKVLILGAGKIGTTVGEMLRETEDYDVQFADAHEKSFASSQHNNLNPILLDVTDEKALRKGLEGQDAVISTLPYYLDLQVAQAAADVGVNYFDPTEDVITARKIREMAAGASSAFVPQCGLAPGFIAIVAHHLVNLYEEPLDVKMRVGALPQYPDNALKYNLTWSLDGLINEYCNPCEVIHEGERREVLPLESLEEISLDGVRYEAFSTSGGIGSLCESLDGRVRNLNYKTIRYPGHRDMIKLLANDLNLCSRRDVFKDVIEYGVPLTEQDVVVIFVTVKGNKDGKLHQESYAKKIYGREDGRWSAIQLTTATALCAVVDLHREGKIPRSGFVKQEDIDFEDFISNRFGKVYA